MPGYFNTLNPLGLLFPLPAGSYEPSPFPSLKSIMNPRAAKQTVEFGDFQTPLRLAKSVCSLLLRTGFEPSSIIEPTCGQGTFLAAALETFPDATARGYEYNPAYAEAAHRTVSRFSQATVQKGDFFRIDWDAELSKLAEPKHDCSRVFEFSVKDGELTNGLGEVVSLETDVVFPLLKSSDVAGHRPPRKYLLVPHRSMEESSLELRSHAPRAWQYLTAHERTLEARASAVYKKRPKFSIFGVGPYSFAPWKVAISGLYKNLRFTKIGPINGQPILLDDTCYFFPCDSEEECLSLYELVSSPLALEFWSSLVFWDSKRRLRLSC